MRLSRALKVRVLRPLITGAFWSSYDGRCYNRVVVFIGTVRLFLRVKKIEKRFVMDVLVTDYYYLYKIFPVRVYETRPRKEDCYTEFISFLNKHQGISRRVFSQRIGSLWGSYPEDASCVKDIISTLQISAIRKRMVSPGYR